MAGNGTRMAEPLVNKVIFSPGKPTYNLNSANAKVCLVPPAGWSKSELTRAAPPPDPNSPVVSSDEATGAEGGVLPDSISAKDPSTLIIPLVITAAPRPREPSWVIVHGHGTGGDANKAVKLYDGLVKKMGINAAVVSVEYPGYAQFPPLQPSASSTDGYSWQRLAPCERGLTMAFDSIIWDLIYRQGVNPKRIIASGRSMGSGVATKVAVKYDLGGLIFFSGYCSIDLVMREKIERKGKIASSVGGWLANYPIFDSISRTPQLQCPAVVIHGEKDPLINISHAHKIFSSIPHERKLLKIDPKGSHTEVSCFNEAVSTFFMELLKDGPPLPTVREQSIRSSAAASKDEEECISLNYWPATQGVQDELGQRKAHADRIWWVSAGISATVGICSVVGAVFGIKSLGGKGAATTETIAQRK